MSEEKVKMPRTDSTQAMKSIFSAYGDDEEAVAAATAAATEESVIAMISPALMDDDQVDNISGSDDEGSSTRSATPRNVPEKRVFEQYQTSPLALETERKKPRLERKATRLVSYGPEEEDEDNEEEVSEDEEEENEVEEDEGQQQLIETDGEQETSEQDVLLPPEPPGKCPKHLQEKIARLYQKVSEGQDLKHSIEQRKHFRNPSIYEKLIEFCAIDEKGTNYPPDLYNPTIWGPDSYYDELAKLQKIEMDRREKEKKERTKIDFVTGVKKTTTEGSTVVEQKRKSKWDAQPCTKAHVVTTTTSNPPVITVTTSHTGHKTTVISAVGTIKKPK